MDMVPAALRPLPAELAPAFTRPTLRRFSLLAAAAVLNAGRHRVANLLRGMSGLTSGEASGYRRVLLAARWSDSRAGHHLARLIVGLVPADHPVILVRDHTVTSHPGPKVDRKARHRDAVRSPHGYTAWRWGRRWVVLAVLVRLPFAGRPWALPVSVELYRTPADDRIEGQWHRTPAQLMRTLLALALGRFLDRRFVFVGDSGFGTHELAVWVTAARGWNW